LFQGKFPLSKEFISQDVNKLSHEELEGGEQWLEHYKNLAREVKERYTMNKE